MIGALVLPLLASGRAAASPTTPASEEVAARGAERLRLVGVILSTRQALLWDEERSEYVLRRSGDEFAGGRIVALENDRLVIERDGGREAVALSSPPIQRLRRARRLPAMIVTANGAVEGEPSAAASEAMPAPPPVTAAPSAPAAPEAPAAAAEPAATVAEPAEAVSSAAPPAVAGEAATAAPPSPPRAAPPAPASPAVPSPPAPHDALPTRGSRPPAFVISRAELDRELSDFAALSKDVAVTPRERGGFQVQRVTPGSFFERLGLHAGDVVLRIDGRPLNAVEDASAAYAWLRVTDHFSVDLLRGGRPLTLRYHITT